MWTSWSLQFTVYIENVVSVSFWPYQVQYKILGQTLITSKLFEAIYSFLAWNDFLNWARFQLVESHLTYCKVAIPTSYEMPHFNGHLKHWKTSVLRPGPQTDWLNDKHLDHQSMLLTTSAVTNPHSLLINSWFNTWQRAIKGTVSTLDSPPLFAISISNGEGTHLRMERQINKWQSSFRWAVSHALLNCADSSHPQT